MDLSEFEGTSLRHIAELAAENINKIPKHCRGGVLRWVLRGEVPGQFLVAVFENDLFAAVVRADSDNIRSLRTYAHYLHNYTHTGCYGSPEKVIAWNKHDGLSGLAQKEREDAGK